jgi:cellulose synthase/poly-beta-1,6-N-acetylglucosamine synthase-like glycosyltransferase
MMLDTLFILVGVLGCVAIVALNLRSWQADRSLAQHLKDEPQTPAVLQAYPKVSVLVAAWNEAPIVREHIHSFLALRYAPKELVLCAGGTDGTYAIACEYQGEQVRVLEQAAGEGKQPALERGYKLATGALVFLTDADCLLTDDAFERTLMPLINEGARVATGHVEPLSSQQSQPFVLHRWFNELYVNMRRSEVSAGLDGRNTALQRAILDETGAFFSGVRSGTDYVLAKNLLRAGCQIRYMRASSLPTPYMTTVREYWRQQTRWLRNVVLHGLRYGARSEVISNLIPSLTSAAMLTLPWLALLFPPLFAPLLLVWLWLALHALLSRVRYMRFGELVSGRSFGKGYGWLPLYIALDFVIWASVLLQYPSRKGRGRW